MGALPLAGYRVVDFCWQAAGPLTTELLANLGADAMKIETASNIDRVRAVPPSGGGLHDRHGRLLRRLQHEQTQPDARSARG